eukprot:COSAG06_NODE_1422_length_9506_cov_6.621346_3_plen_77_part_00
MRSESRVRFCLVVDSRTHAHAHAHTHARGHAVALHVLMLLLLLPPLFESNGRAVRCAVQHRDCDATTVTTTHRAQR